MPILPSRGLRDSPPCRNHIFGRFGVFAENGKQRDVEYGMESCGGQGIEGVEGENDPGTEPPGEGVARAAPPGQKEKQMENSKTGRPNPKVCDPRHKVIEKAHLDRS